MESALILALRRAVDAAPDDVALRLHLADQLAAIDDHAGAIDQIAAVLRVDPSSAEARAAMGRVLRGAGTQGSETTGESPGIDAPTGVDPPPEQTLTRADDTAETSVPGAGFDWAAAEQQVADPGGSMFVEHPEAKSTDEEPRDAEPAEDPVQVNRSRFAVENSTITLDDVGGMRPVKDRLEAAFLAPLANPRLRELYGKSLRGGLLLYGPPGCGKTFIARALAGELQAKFLSVGIADILDPFFGQTERNLHDAFQLARREAPCVLFFDEIDALGARRTQHQTSMLRGAVNQLLTELDGIDGANEGVFVLAATNQPWDVDPALKRPGRLDRTVLVLPPDADARQAIFRYHLRERPVAQIDLRRLGKATEGLSGADIAYVCELATESALMDGVRTGDVRSIGMSDIEQALGQVRPSIAAWLDSARNLVLFGDDDGTYAELRKYLKKVKRL